MLKILSQVELALGYAIKQKYCSSLTHLQWRNVTKNDWFSSSFAVKNYLIRKLMSHWTQITTTSLLLLASLATTFLWLSTGTCTDEMVADMAVFTERPALLAVVPCFVAQQLNRHEKHIIRFLEWTRIIQSAIPRQSHTHLWQELKGILVCLVSHTYAYKQRNWP